MIADDAQTSRKAAAPSRARMLGAAALVGAAAFLYRFLSHARLTNDHYMHLVWAQQVLLGEVPGRDFVDPGMPLMFSLSAVVQHFWPGPFSEVVLSCLLLGLAAALTSDAVTRLTATTTAGVVAAALEVGLAPRLYGYPKILVPAATLWALSLYAQTPTARRRAVVILVVGLSILLRHDLGLFALVAAGVGIAANGGGQWRRTIRELAQFMLGVAVVLLPYLILVQWSEGWSENLREGLEFSRGEAHQLLLPWNRAPRFAPGSSPEEQAFVVLYYSSYASIPGLLACAAFGRHHRATRAMLAAAATLLTAYCLVILRHPLPARVPDLASVLAVAWVALIAEGGRRLWRWTAAPTLRAGWVLAGLMLAAAPASAAWRVAHVSDRLRETRIADGWAKVVERVLALADAGTRRPWTWYWPAGEMPEVVEYLSRCTAPRDRILLTWFAPQYYFFSQRGFAAGQQLFSSSASFATERDNSKMVTRLQSEHVPLVLRNEGTRDEFARAHPMLDDFLDRNYEWFGEFRLRDGTPVRIGRRREMDAVSSFGTSGWPCGFNLGPKRS